MTIFFNETAASGWGSRCTDVPHDSSLAVASFIHNHSSGDMTHVWHDTCVTWLIDIRDMPHSCVKYIIQAYAVTYFCVWNDASYARYTLFIHGTWLFRTCAITHSYVWHDMFVTSPGTGRVVNSYKILNHYFPASAESAVLPALPMDKQVIFFAFCFFLS